MRTVQCMDCPTRIPETEHTCAKCTATEAVLMQDLPARVSTPFTKPFSKESINEYYLKYYLNKPALVSRHVKMATIVDHAWGAGLSSAQTVIDCMNNGFSMCISIPYIKQRWARIDKEYAAHCAEMEKQKKYEVVGINNDLLFCSPGVVEEVPINIEISEPTTYGYTLWYTDECNIDHAHEFEGVNDGLAIQYAIKYCKGNEGLWQYVSLSGGPTDDEIPFVPF